MSKTKLDKAIEFLEEYEALSNGNQQASAAWQSGIRPSLELSQLKRQAMQPFVEQARQIVSEHYKRVYVPEFLKKGTHNHESKCRSSRTS